MKRVILTPFFLCFFIIGLMLYQNSLSSRVPAQLPASPTRCTTYINPFLEEWRKEIYDFSEPVYKAVDNFYSNHDHRFFDKYLDLKAPLEGRRLSPHEIKQVPIADNMNLTLFHEIARNEREEVHAAVLGVSVVTVKKVKLTHPAFERTDLATRLINHETHIPNFLNQHNIPTAKFFGTKQIGEELFIMKEYIIGYTVDDLQRLVDKGDISEEIFDEALSKLQAFRKKLVEVQSSEEFIEFADEHDTFRSLVASTPHYIDGKWMLYHP